MKEAATNQPSTSQTPANEAKRGCPAGIKALEGLVSMADPAMAKTLNYMNMGRRGWVAMGVEEAGGMPVGSSSGSREFCWVVADESGRPTGFVKVSREDGRLFDRETSLAVIRTLANVDGGIDTGAYYADVGYIDKQAWSFEASLKVLKAVAMRAEV